jgi:hypothetical protein
MTYEKNLPEPVELNELELDAVAGGQRRGPRQEAEGGLIVANVNVQDVQVGVAAQVIGETLEFAQETGS